MVGVPRAQTRNFSALIPENPPRSNPQYGGYQTHWRTWSSSGSSRTRGSPRSPRGTLSSPSAVADPLLLVRRGLRTRGRLRGPPLLARALRPPVLGARPLGQARPGPRGGALPRGGRRGRGGPPLLGARGAPGARRQGGPAGARSCAGAQARSPRLGPIGALRRHGARIQDAGPALSIGDTWIGARGAVYQ